jgi:hypothetical protein
MEVDRLRRGHLDSERIAKLALKLESVSLSKLKRTGTLSDREFR